MPEFTQEEKDTIQEATALLNSLSEKVENLRKLHAIGPWHEEWNPSTGRNANGYDHEGCTHCEVSGKCDTLLILDGEYPYPL